MSREADAGYYVLLIRLKEARELSVGAWGSALFPAGLYAYVGRARRGLSRRLARHAARKKTLRWHVDWLLSCGTIVGIFSWPLAGRSECSIAERLAALPEATWRPRGFGSSDCRCKGHLIHFTAPPNEGVFATL